MSIKESLRRVGVQVSLYCLWGDDCQVLYGGGGGVGCLGFLPHRFVFGSLSGSVKIFRILNYPPAYFFYLHSPSIGVHPAVFWHFSSEAAAAGLRMEVLIHERSSLES